MTTAETRAVLLERLPQVVGMVADAVLRLETRGHEAHVRRADVETLKALLNYFRRLALPVSGEEPRYDLVAHLTRQREFSTRTFGPGVRTAGVLDHIRKELVEIEAHPADLTEWIDVVLLALDGAWRAGHEPVDIAYALMAKQAKNEAREWPDWRTQPADRAIQHVKSADAREAQPAERVQPSADRAIREALESIRYALSRCREYGYAIRYELEKVEAVLAALTAIATSFPTSEQKGGS